MESEEKQRFMNNSKWKQRKKVFFRLISADWESKTEKFVPPAEKQLSYPEQAYHLVSTLCKMVQNTLRFAAKRTANSC